ncbi:DUF945 family protein, partial [Escherichia coli]|uniref:DUF945 family protein n=1 Tax=Escherichia coli TaxID=562 RepID=UPI003D319F56
QGQDMGSGKLTLKVDNVDGQAWHQFSQQYSAQSQALLAKPELNGGQRKEAIELAGSTAQTLLGLIGNILDIDKIESGKYQVTPQWSDVAQLVSQQCHT